MINSMRDPQRGQARRKRVRLEKEAPRVFAVVESEDSELSDDCWECPRGDCNQINQPEDEYCQGEKCKAFRKWAEEHQNDPEPED